jgi:hypothetical protein
MIFHGNNKGRSALLLIVQCRAALAMTRSSIAHSPVLRPLLGAPVGDQCNCKWHRVRVPHDGVAQLLRVFLNGGHDVIEEEVTIRGEAIGLRRANVFGIAVDRSADGQRRRQQ